MSVVQRRISAWVIAVLLAAAIGIVPASTHTRQDTETALKIGRRLYSQYCRSCHGEEAAGDGPAATALKVRPADLTQVTKKHEGFPTEKVMDWIDGEKYAVGHGSREMPVWGKRFRRSADGGSSTVSEIQALTEYLQSIQQK